jgi:hypothetical protein
MTYSVSNGLRPVGSAELNKIMMMMVMMMMIEQTYLFLLNMFVIYIKLQV